ncbi:MAG: hypothetical protein WCW25_03435 [Patescibacteria group bacterium]|jgi:hypothetical protein
MAQQTKLKDQEFFAKVQKTAEDLINDNNFTEAYNLGAGLNDSIEKAKNFKIESQELYRKYKELAIKLLWIGLPVMTKNEVRRIFRDHFVKSFAIFGYDHWVKLKPILLAIMSLDDRDAFKKQLTQVLAENQEKITNKKLLISSEEKDPTVGNWILDYNRSLGTSGMSGIARTQYLVNSINIKNLSKEEKERIQKLFELYERLKLSSQTLEGYEMDVPVNEMGVNGTIRQGVFEPTPPETKNDKIIQRIIDEMMGRIKPTASGGEDVVGGTKGVQNELTQLKILASEYPAGSLERRAIEEEMGKLNAE